MREQDIEDRLREDVSAAARALRAVEGWAAAEVIGRARDRLREALARFTAHMDRPQRTGASSECRQAGEVRRAG